MADRQYETKRMLVLQVNRDRDPLAPKPNKTPFNFFSVDARVKAKDIYPAMSQTDITKKVGTCCQTIHRSTQTICCVASA